MSGKVPWVDSVCADFSVFLFSDVALAAARNSPDDRCQNRDAQHKFLQHKRAHAKYGSRVLWVPLYEVSASTLGNGRNTVSRVLFWKRDLTEFLGKLGECCEKLGEFAFAHKDYRGQTRHMNIRHISKLPVTPVTDPPGREPG